MVIDVHAHLLPPQYFEILAGASGTALGVTANGDNWEFSVGGRHFSTFTPDFYDVNQRLARMDAVGVATQVLSLPPPMVFWGAPDESLRACQITNDYYAQLAEQHPARFVACAAVPLRDPVAATTELRRAVTELGHRMVLMGSNIAGMQLDDPSLEPFYAEAERLGVPIYVHPLNPAGGDCMGAYRLDISVGFPLDTTLAASRVLLSGLLLRHPGLRFCWAHMGGVLPWLFPRLQLVHDSGLPGARAALGTGPAALPEQFLFDTTVPSMDNLRYGVEVLGAQRLLFGTDMPFFHDATPEILALINGAPFLDEGDRDAILEGNARRLLGLV